jgi:hypothetical protein
MNLSVGINSRRYALHRVFGFRVPIAARGWHRPIHKSDRLDDEFGQRRLAVTINHEGRA